MSLAAAKGGAEKALEHAEVRFHLPTLAVLRNGPMVSKELTKEPACDLAWSLLRPSAIRRDDSNNPKVVVKKLVMIFGVVADIAQQSIEGMPPMCLSSNTVQFDVVRLGAAVDHDAEEQVAFDVNHG